MAAALLWYSRLPADSEPWKAALETPSTLVPPVDVLIDVLPAVLLFGLGISCVVAPLTSTLMGSISTRFSGLGSAINNSISRVGQPLLGAFIFIAVSATFYATLGTLAPTLDTSSAAVQAAFQPLNPPPPGATPEQVSAATAASMDAFHLAMRASAVLLVIGGRDLVRRAPRGSGRTAGRGRRSGGQRRGRGRLTRDRRRDDRRQRGLRNAPPWPGMTMSADGAHARAAGLDGRLVVGRAGRSRASRRHATTGGSGRRSRPRRVTISEASSLVWPGRQPELGVGREAVAVAVVVEPQVVAVARPEVHDLGVREQRDVHRVVRVVVADEDVRHRLGGDVQGRQRVEDPRAARHHPGIGDDQGVAVADERDAAADAIVGVAGVEEVHRCHGRDATATTRLVHGSSRHAR